MCNCIEPKLIHQEKKTNQYIIAPFSKDYRWKRVDIYHCGKCGEIITKVKEAVQRDEPEWY